MIDSLFADTVVSVHAAFVLFAVFGGLFVFYRPRLAWLHVPAFIWAVLVETAGWICPLTSLENFFRARAGATSYRSDFTAHYLTPLLYPEGLTRRHQVWLGIIVLALNLAVYLRLIRRRRTGP